MLHFPLHSEGTWTVVRHRFINLSVDSPVWSETMMSAAADQSPEATATLPRVAVPSRSQHPVSWFERRGVEEGIGDS